MVTLENLVSQINARTFTPDNITSTEVFLHQHKDKNLIEHVLSQSRVNISLAANTLSRYIVLLNEEKTLPTRHYLALAKYIRTVCLYMIHADSLPTIDKIIKDIPKFFPFLSPSHEHSGWMPAFLEDTQIIETIYQLLAHSSYKIRSGKLIADFDNLEICADNANNITQALRVMAGHPLYTTHRNAHINQWNNVTHQTAQTLQSIPILSTFQWAAQTLASNAGYDHLTSTGRTRKILSYTTAARNFRTENLANRSLAEQLSHIEILFYAYLEKPVGKRAELSTLLDKLIKTHRHLPGFLAGVVKIIAPEPLGEMRYGMQRYPANLLNELSCESNMDLLAACAAFFTEEDKTNFINTLKLFNNTPPKPDTITFNAETREHTRWLAYFLCMGNFPMINSVTIQFNDVSYRDHILISFLMGSEKLVLSSNRRIDEVILSPLPAACVLQNTDSAMNHEIMMKMAADTLHRGLMNVRLAVTATDEQICAVMKALSIFEHAPPNAVVYIRATTQKNIIIDFTLSSINIRPGIISASTENSTTELIRLYISAFSSQEKKSLDSWHCRPTALPSNVVVREELLTGIGRRWVLAYGENLRFLYDLYAARATSNEETRFETGYFSSLGYGDQKRLAQDFPGLVDTSPASDKPFLIGSVPKTRDSDSDSDLGPESTYSPKEYTSLLTGGGK